MSKRPSGKFMLLNRAFVASFGSRRDERTPTHFGSGFQSLLRACDSGRAMQTYVRPPNVAGGLRSLAPDQSASQSRLQGAVGPSSGPCEIVDLDSHHQQRACEKTVETEQCRQHQCAAVAILNVGRMRYRMLQQPYRIGEDMEFLTLDLFSRIVAIRINAAHPFSALFTLWLPIMHAVGLASRHMASRLRT